VPKTPSPITELERMIETRRAPGVIKDIETAPDDWLRTLPSTGEVRGGGNGNGHKQNDNGNPGA
jgi:hypothetical protein